MAGPTEASPSSEAPGKHVQSQASARDWNPLRGNSTGFLPTFMSSSTAPKRRWDQQGSEEPSTSEGAPKTSKDDAKSASDAAAAAAAIAAKIAKQFASGGFDFGKDEPEFTQDIDINDVRNRYLLTRGSTQEQVSLRDGEAVEKHG